jgi:hypothetical protein
MVTQMVNLVHQFEVSQVTFPIRASYMQQSSETLHYLLEKCEGSTLTIWNSEKVSSELYQWIVNNFSAKKTFIDVQLA